MLLLSSGSDVTPAASCRAVNAVWQAWAMLAVLGTDSVEQAGSSKPPLMPRESRSAAHWHGCSDRLVYHMLAVVFVSSATGVAQACKVAG